MFRPKLNILSYQVMMAVPAPALGQALNTLACLGNWDSQKPIKYLYLIIYVPSKYFQRII